MMPQLPLVLYMRRAQRRAAPTPSMRHRNGNSQLHPSEIFHRPTLAARSSRRGQAPARDPGEPDCDRSEAQISRSPEGSRVAPSPITKTFRTVWLSVAVRLAGSPDAVAGSMPQSFDTLKSVSPIIGWCKALGLLDVGRPAGMLLDGIEERPMILTPACRIRV